MPRTPRIIVESPLGGSEGFQDRFIYEQPRSRVSSLGAAIRGLIPRENRQSGIDHKAIDSALEQFDSRTDEAFARIGKSTLDGAEQ